MTDPGKLFDIKVRTIDGEETTLAPYRGKVLLIVNVASQCGLTPQYAALEELYRKYRDRGLVVLGFPCNQFGAQEPACEADIKTFTKERFEVTFPLFEKIEVNGDHAHPLYRYLKGEKAGLLGTEAIKWNFTKFLVDRSGQHVERFAPTTTPTAIEPVIEKLLAAS
jgi:glutathione peroxidase